MMFGANYRQYSLLTLLAAGLLVAAFLFGGASRLHALRLLLVELAALPVLVLALSRTVSQRTWTEHRLAMWLLGIAVALPLLQLIPLPPGVWMALPGRDQAGLALEVAGLEPGWAPISLTPDLTWRAFLGLLPPVAIFLAALHISAAERQGLVNLVLGLMALSLIVGVLQLTIGAEIFYVWPTTGRGTVTGLFANRNHLASLMVAAIPLIAFSAAAYSRRSSEHGKLALMLTALAIGILIVAVAAIRSRAGILLLGPCLVLTLVGLQIAIGRRTLNRAMLGLIAAAAIALALVASLGLGPILERFDSEGSTESRFEKWPIVAEAAQSYLPLGSGFGSFDTVFRSVEPLEQLDSTFFNQAHNDYLELWLEAGWPAVALILAFLVWFARRSWTTWREPPSTGNDVRRGASLAILVVLLHSAGDYPLRTETWAVTLAFLAALLEIRATPGELVRRSRRRRKVQSQT